MKQPISVDGAKGARLETQRGEDASCKASPRIVFVNTYYPKFIASHYRENPDAARAPYAAQLQGLIEQRFGDSDFYSNGMQLAGWQASDLIVNCDPLQRAWAGENGFQGQGLEIAVEQIRQLNPQVVYLHDLGLATTAFLNRIRPHTQLIVGQIASPIPEHAHLKGLDILFSSFPHFVERFRQAGITAYYQPLAFDARVLDGLETQEAVHDVTFVGGLSQAHGRGLVMLQQVAGMVPVKFWGYGAECLPSGSPIRDRHHGEVWGLDMFRTLAQSRITLNRHIDVSENYANNMRLFEATGCGALLITDYQDNLNELFEIGREIVAYRTPEECAAMVRYYQENPREAAEIARNGQRRTLSEHTYVRRMAQTAEVLRRHLRYRNTSMPDPDLGAISYGHQEIPADHVTAQMTTAWKDRSIPAKQRALVQQELMGMYDGAPPVVYRVMAEALRAITEEGSSVLEIGCASGYYYEVMEYLLKRRIDYTGVDYSEALIDMARDYYPRPDFHAADGANLPFTDRTFEVVVSSGILLHVPNYPDHIAETARVARSHVIAHRTPVCRKRPTQYMKKQAYGVQTVELCFNEKEIVERFVDQGLRLTGHIEYSADVQQDQYDVTYIFEKRKVPATGDQPADHKDAIGSGPQQDAAPVTMADVEGKGRKRYYCTYFDSNYLFKAMAMIESLQTHESDFTLFAVCLDELAYRVIRTLGLSNVVPVALEQIEDGDDILLAAKGNRSRVEYYFTLTATIIRHLLKKYPQIDILTYADADLYFFSTPDPIFEKLGSNSVLIHGHRFSESEAYKEALYGTYNVGLLCFRNDANGNVVLDWWRRKCLEWCYNRSENGKYADQGYLNDWPERFNGVVVMDHKGVGLALWNHDRYRYRRDAGGKVMVDELPLIFYHYSALQMVYPDFVLPDKYGNYPRFSVEMIQWMLIPYVRSLFRAVDTVLACFPDFTTGVKDNVRLTEVHDFLARHQTASNLDRRGLPHAKTPLEDHWGFYQSAIPLVQTPPPHAPQDRDALRNGESAVGMRSPKSDSMQPDPQAILDAIEWMLGAGHPEAARWAQEKLQTQMSDNAQVLNHLAMLAYQCGDMDTAMNRFEHAVALAPQNQQFLKDLGDFNYAVMQRVENALAQYERACALSPDDDDALVRAGHMCICLERFDDARRYYQRALSLAPGNADARQCMIKLNDRVSGQLSRTGVSDAGISQRSAC